MCNDELEGLSNMKDPDQLDSIIHSVNSDIDKYLKQTKKSGTVNLSKAYNFKRIFAVAASILLLITAGFTVNYFMKSNSESLADMQKSESIELSEESNEMIEKEAENDKNVNRDIVGSTVDEENISTVIVDQSDENDIDELISGESNINTESIADDDMSDRILTEEAEEDLTIIISDISENKKTGSEPIDNEAISIDEDPAKSETNDSFAGFATRHVPDNIRRAKKEEAVNYKSIKNSALLSYDEKVYNEAKGGFKDYLKYNSNDSEIIYKYGVASFYTKDYTIALKNFDKIISFGKSKYFEDAEWYKSQTLLKQGKNKEAADLLRKIVSGNGKYKNKASDVLKQFD